MRLLWAISSLEDNLHELLRVPCLIRHHSRKAYFKMLKMLYDVLQISILIYSIRLQLKLY